MKSQPDDNKPAAKKPDDKKPESPASDAGNNDAGDSDAGDNDAGDSDAGNVQPRDEPGANPFEEYLNDRPVEPVTASSIPLPQPQQGFSDAVYRPPDYEHSVFEEPVFAGPSPHPRVGGEKGVSIAGFILSILGLASCGVASVVGLVLSIIGLQSEPRGLAVAGFIINLLGIVMLLIGFVFFGGGMMAVKSIASLNFPMMNTQTNMSIAQANGKIAGRWSTTGTLPDQTEGTNLISGLTDAWNNQIEYETDGESFSLIAPGPDGRSGTADDGIFGPYLTPEETESSFGLFYDPTVPVNSPPVFVPSESIESPAMDKEVESDGNAESDLPVSAEESALFPVGPSSDEPADSRESNEDQSER